MFFKIIEEDFFYSGTAEKSEAAIVEIPGYTTNQTWIVDGSSSKIEVIRCKDILMNLPPNGFAYQFIKDLKLPQVLSLDQLKWVFDGKKVDKLSQEDFVNALRSSKNELFNSKAKMLFENWLEENFIDADDLMEAIERNGDWFGQVFQRVQ